MYWARHITTVLALLLVACGPCGGGPCGGNVHEVQSFEVPREPASSASENGEQNVKRGRRRLEVRDPMLSHIHNPTRDDNGSSMLADAFRRSDLAHEALGLTAYACLASGYTHRGKEPCSRLVGRAIRKFKDEVRALDSSRPPSLNPLIALVLIKSYGMTGNVWIRAEAQRALTDAANQCRRGGVTDETTAGWMLLTLMYARRTNNGMQRRHKGTKQLLNIDESSFAILADWCGDDVRNSYRRRAVAALATLLFAPKDTARAELESIARDLTRRPYSRDTRDGTTDLIGSVFAGIALGFVDSNVALAWRQKTSGAANEQSHALQEQAKASTINARSIRTLALLAMLEKKTWLGYDLPSIDTVR